MHCALQKYAGDSSTDPNTIFNTFFEMFQVLFDSMSTVGNIPVCPPVPPNLCKCEHDILTENIITYANMSLCLVYFLTVYQSNLYDCLTNKCKHTVSFVFQHSIQTEFKFAPKFDNSKLLQISILQVVKHLTCFFKT